jgi:short-subunit dehydrogenase
MRRRVEHQTIVITGASSGIGLATALACARKGARVVMAARGERSLSAAVLRVEETGAPVIGVVTDVSGARAIDELASAAVARFGRIDAWINNAAVATYGTVDELSIEEIDRVIAVDLLGAIYGSRAALAHMKERGTGTIVNISSVLAARSFPLMSTYCAAKAGIAAFSESLRVELLREYPDIVVTLISPASVNTPFYEHARSKREVAAKPYPPSYDPDTVARSIVFALEHRRREIFVGGAGRALARLEQLSPALVDRYLLQGDRAVDHMLSDREAPPRDNLFASVEGPVATRGRWPSLRRSMYTEWFVMHPVRFALSVAAIGGACSALWRRLR